MAGFFAYPSSPTTIGDTIELAVSRLKQHTKISIETWRALNVPGHFLSEKVNKAIEDCDFFVADITRLNFNVTYEIGYAIANRKPMCLTRNRAVTSAQPDPDVIGIYDTLGYFNYENAEDLAAVLEPLQNSTPLDIPIELDQTQPAYVIELPHRTDWAIRLISRLKKARVFFRSFDPREQSRMSGPQALREVAQSFGVLVPLLEKEIRDSEIHNLRASFVIGLALGLGKELTVLQNGETPIAKDYRDFVTVTKHVKMLDEAIEDFAARVFQSVQLGSVPMVAQSPGFLANLNIGASAAENEFRSLGAYFVQTDGFRRARRGDSRLVIGRKGAGKSALFFQIRDSIRQEAGSLVVDLKPDGFKLLKLKEAVLRFLSDGSLDHTITAFWEYLLLIEVSSALLDTDRILHMRDHRLFEPYRRLANAVQSDTLELAGDFSERVGELIERMADRFVDKYGEEKDQRLRTGEVTELVHFHDIHELVEALEAYVPLKNNLWILFDNIDKGWPPHGIENNDVRIVRALLEATRKLERNIRRAAGKMHTIVFLRNDVFEILIDQTIDRGKESRVLLDWDDPDLLRELLRRRIANSEKSELGALSFEQMWPRVAATHIRGEESSQFLIDRSLMRPRNLIDLVSHCIGYAINLGHEKVETEDLLKGLKAYSNDLVSDFDLEIRDVYPNAEQILYEFIGARSILSLDEVVELLINGNVEAQEVVDFIEVLLWYGFLGLLDKEGEPRFIYSYNYNMALLRGVHKRMVDEHIRYVINPAFWEGLEVEVSD